MVRQLLKVIPLNDLKENAPSFVRRSPLGESIRTRSQASAWLKTVRVCSSPRTFVHPR